MLFWAKVAPLEGDEQSVTIENLSSAGFLMQSLEKFRAGNLVYVRFPNGDRLPAVIKCCREDRYGCKFVRGLKAREFLKIIREREVAETVTSASLVAALLRKLFWAALAFSICWMRSRQR